MERFGSPEHSPTRSDRLDQELAHPARSTQSAPANPRRGRTRIENEHTKDSWCVLIAPCRSRNRLIRRLSRRIQPEVVRSHAVDTRRLRQVYGEDHEEGADGRREGGKAAFRAAKVNLADFIEGLLNRFRYRISAKALVCRKSSLRSGRRMRKRERLVAVLRWPRRRGISELRARSLRILAKRAC